MKNRSIRKKLLGAVVIVVVLTVALTTAIKTISDLLFRDQTENLLMEQAMSAASVFVKGQTDAVNEQIVSLTEKMTRTAAFAEYLYEHPDEFVPVHNRRPSEFPADTTGVTFHWSAFSEAEVNSEELIREADMLSALQGEFRALTQTYPMIQSLYVATASHINIGYDENVLAKVGSFYDPIASEASWYLRPMESGEVYVSDAYSDVFGRGLLVTVSAPYTVDGQVHGVIGADIGIRKIEENVLDIDMSGIAGYAVLLTADGEPISAPGLTEDSTAADILGSNYEQAVADMKTDREGVVQSVIGGSNRYIVFNTMESTGWKLGVLLSEEDILAPVKAIDGMIIRIAVISIIISLILLGVLLAVVNRFCRKFTAPILQLADDVAEIGDGDLDYRSTIHTGDEIESLSRSFETMTLSLKEYIRNLTNMTAENERIGAELNVAARIQASMLPCIFPAFPNRDDFDIYATMNPAKEVGGDFYDFFMVDDTHIAVVIADVSGKGVPAALFMVIAKTLIKDHTTPGADLGRVFSTVNSILCESNSGEMFVTAFEGVLDLVTGEFRFVNAGHEMPFIARGGGRYELYKIRPRFVLAGMDGMQYEEGSTVLQPGDKVFQYTDGVTEATDKDNKLYGIERLERVLARNSDKIPMELLPAVKQDIDEFVGDAPQFDDITMLCLEYKKKCDNP